MFDLWKFFNRQIHTAKWFCGNRNIQPNPTDAKGRFVKKMCIIIPTLCACGCNEVVWGGHVFKNGHSTHNKGRKHAEYHNKKISIAGMGNKYCLGHKPSEETRKKLSEATWDCWHYGEKRYQNNNGGRHCLSKDHHKLALARKNHKRKGKGFILITSNNPYDEPIDYHHIHPDMPYVIPCPQRIHRMFYDRGNTYHFNNVNAFLGFVLDV